MSTFLPKDDLEFHEAFREILFDVNFSDYINEIIVLIFNNELDSIKVNEILKKYGLNQIEDMKEAILNLLLVYINIVLNDNVITENEARNVNLLKRFFKIKESDFFNYRRCEVEKILYKQFVRIYENNHIDTEEALHKVGLQELFGLGYDEFLKFNNKEAEAALRRGANLNDLDTVFKPSEYLRIKADIEGKDISQKVKD